MPSLVYPLELECCVDDWVLGPEIKISDIILIFLFGFGSSSISFKINSGSNVRFGSIDVSTSSKLDRSR